MQDYNVRLESPLATSYRCQRAANSVDLDLKKKSIHQLNIRADLSGDWNVGVIVGASGSGKTSLAKQMFGEECFTTPLKNDVPIIEQFAQHYNYEQCAELLQGIGLNSIPCWCRPVYTLSNGQRARAEAALLLSSEAALTIIDEWTSVVDRTVAAAMSHCVQKFARKQKKKLILCSCHFDVLPWLKPDWVIDCNNQSFHKYQSDDWDKKKASCAFMFENVAGKHGSFSASIII